MKAIKIFLILCVFSGCTNPSKEKYTANAYHYPDSVDTRDKLTIFQDKKIYDFETLSFDNLFDGARLNLVTKDSIATYKVLITPENEPINSSPWYAFRVVANQPTTITVRLDYGTYRHRYSPKVSFDKESWTELPDFQSVWNFDSTMYSFNLNLEADTTYVAAQELFTTRNLTKWMNELTKNTLVNAKVIGKSNAGRDLHLLDMYEGDKNEKDLIVLLSRQHPPEVTGFFALQSFIDQLLNEGQGNNFFKKYRVLVYPMLNPDGVDMGNWRHNQNGVDLNRDWAYYRQKEVREVANSIVSEAKSNDANVILGLDFHSTYYDIFYTQAKEELMTPTTNWFRNQWFDKIEERIPNYKINEAPSGLGKPVSKGWFYTQFNAEGITYEIGDKTPRDTIKLIGKVTATSMMDILLNEDNRKQLAR